jgi:hypothetical protein
MAEPAKWVEYNDSGTWRDALVAPGPSAGGTGNYDLYVLRKDEGGVSYVENVPQGAESGHWR